MSRRTTKTSARHQAGNLSSEPRSLESCCFLAPEASWIPMDLRVSDVDPISKLILACSDSTLRDFQLLCRNVGDLDRWKATEFRKFYCVLDPYVWIDYFLMMRVSILCPCLCPFIFSFVLMSIKLAKLLRHLFPGAPCKRFICCMPPVIQFIMHML